MLKIPGIVLFIFTCYVNFNHVLSYKLTSANWPSIYRRYVYSIFMYAVVSWQNMISLSLQNNRVPSCELMIFIQRHLHPLIYQHTLRPHVSTFLIFKLNNVPVCHCRSHLIIFPIPQHCLDADLCSYCWSSKLKSCALSNDLLYMLRFCSYLGKWHA